MSSNKTIPEKESPHDFIEKIDSLQKKSDSKILLNIIAEITGKPPVMWGASIVGFDQYHYTYDSGREGDFFIVGFSPRKQNLSIYIMPGFEKYEELLGKLGKYKTGKSCLYIKTLEDINLDILKTLISSSVAYMRQKYPE